jgi:hypothetical protein
VKKKLIRLLTHNLQWKLLSVAVSFLLWLAVVAQPEVATLLTVPVLYKNIRPDLSLAPGCTEMIRVELHGTPAKLSRANLSEATVTLDLNGMGQMSTAAFPLTSDNLHLPQGVTFVRAIPAQISVKLTPLNAKLENGTETRP